MKKINLLLGLLILSGLLFAQSPGGIRGKILDEKGEVVPFCNISLVTDKVIDGTMTDMDGFFNFKGLNSGIYSLKISYIGYANTNVKNINVSNGKISFIETVNLVQKALVFDGDIEIYGGPKLIDPEHITGISIDNTTLKTIPNKRNLTSMLTAVSADIKATEDGKGIIVRGSRPNTSALYINGIRLEDMSSSVNGSAIKSMIVYTGGIPASYGDITGGIVVIETKGFFDFYYEWRGSH